MMDQGAVLVNKEQEQERKAEEILYTVKWTNEGMDFLKHQIVQLTESTELPEVEVDGETQTVRITPIYENLDQDGLARLIHLDARLKHYQNRKKVFDGILAALGDSERLFVKLRYVDELEMEAVAKAMRISRSHVFTVRKRALSRVWTLIKDSLIE